MSLNVGLAGLCEKRTRAPIPSAWTQRTSQFGGSDKVYTIVRGGSYWCATGYTVSGGLHALISTATDPTGTWTLNGSPPFVAGYPSRHTSIYQDSTFVIGGVSAGDKIAYAADPTGAWTENADLSDVGAYVSAVGYDGTYWLVGGTGSQLASHDTLAGTWDAETVASMDETYGMAHDGTTWCIVGNGGNMDTATDPTGTWTARTSSFGSDDIENVAYDGSTYWVAVGAAAKLATATDPTGTWTQRTSSFTDPDRIYSVAYGNGVWVAVGSGGKLATATDPTGTWTQQTSSFGSDDIYDVWYGTDGYWVAVGDKGKLATSYP